MFASPSCACASGQQAGPSGRGRSHLPTFPCRAPRGSRSLKRGQLFIAASAAPLRGGALAAGPSLPHSDVFAAVAQVGAPQLRGGASPSRADRRLFDAFPFLSARRFVPPQGHRARHQELHAPRRCSPVHVGKDQRFLRRSFPRR